MIEANRARSSGSDIISDPKLRRLLPFKVKLGEKTVECYEAKRDIHLSHPVVELRDGDKTAFKLALKVSDAEILPAGQMQLIVNRDFLPETVATLLKMAHLTQFAVFGYRYAFGTAGLMVAEILRTFLIENQFKPRREQIDAAARYFPQHAGMVMPAVGYDRDLIKGSIEDRRFLVCLGSSGAWYALGVFIRIGDQMYVVLVPSENAESVGTYFDLIKEMHTKSFKFQLVEFVPGTESEAAYWIARQQEYTFKPHPEN